MRSWARANDNSNGRNATAIEKDKLFGHFEREVVAGVTIGYVWLEKPKSSW